jgi:hypothetical protein
MPKVVVSERLGSLFESRDRRNSVVFREELEEAEEKG